MTRPVRWFACVAVLGTLVALGGCAPTESDDAATPASRPPVLLITLDTLRADAVGFVGGHDRTPTIDALAREGFHFNHAVSPTPLTLPAHTSILSGLIPHHHGVHDNGQVVPRELPLLQERMRDAGYATGAFVSAYVLEATYGLDRGFDRYDALLDSGNEGWLERRAEDTIGSAIEWIGAQQGPWFAWVHLYDAHAPYDPPPSFRRDGEQGGYEGEVAYMDSQLKRLLAAARAGGVEPLVVVTADHGEAFGEHGEQIHGLFVYDTTMVVPLVFSHPSLVARGSSAQSPRLVDIAPTLLSLLGLPALPGIEGVDLAPLFVGETQDVPAALVQSMLPWITYGWHPLIGLRTEAWKYIEAPTPELYDLASDPGELTNVFTETHPEGARLRVLLDQIRSETPRHEPGSGTDPESIARLQSLGYVGSGGSVSGDWSRAPDPKTRLKQYDELLAAEAQHRTGQFDLAKSRFEHILTEDPDNRFATIRLGMGYLKLNQPERAVGYLTHSVELDPRQAEARFALADALTRLGRYAEAIPHWQECVALQPRRFGAWANLGSTLMWMNKPAEAVEALTQAVELAPDNVGLRTNLGIALIATGRNDEAIAALTKAGELDPAAFTEQARLAVLLLQRGREQEGKAWLERVPTTAKDYAASQFHLARLSAQSDPERARTYLAEALRADPRLAARAQSDALLRPLQPPTR